jgi:hypothetical protein
MGTTLSMPTIVMDTMVVVLILIINVIMVEASDAGGS